MMNRRENESIVANDPATSNWMRYVNSARNYVELNIKNFVDYSGNVYYIALEDIQPHTEILANYPHSLNYYPELFWTGSHKEFLTYVSFDCKVCNSSFRSPILAKDHIRKKHYPDKNNIDEHMLIRDPKTHDLMEILGRLKAQLTKESTVTPNSNYTGMSLEEGKSLNSRNKRSVSGSKKGKVKSENRMGKTTKTHVKNSTKIGKKGAKTDVISTLKSTNHFTTTTITTPYKITTTEKIHHLNLDFSSSNNLEEKIKQRIIDAGIDINEMKNANLTTPVGQTPDHTYQEFFLSAIRSSSGGMDPAHFQDFMNKMRILKTHGTLNVSEDQAAEAMKNYITEDVESKFGENDKTTDPVTLTMTTILNTLKNLLNKTATLISQTKVGKPFTTVKITYSKKRTRKTTFPCTCPTYSDYRVVWHNISQSSTEHEFNINKSNNIIQIRHRWYNESSEPQYPDVRGSSSSSTEETTVTVINKTKTSKSKVTRKRSKTSNMPIKHTRRKVKSMANHSNTQTSTKKIKTKARLKINKTIKT